MDDAKADDLSICLNEFVQGGPFEVDTKLSGISVALEGEKPLSSRLYGKVFVIGAKKTRPRKGKSSVFLLIAGRGLHSNEDIFGSILFQRAKEHKVFENFFIQFFNKKHELNVSKSKIADLNQNIVSFGSW